MLLLRKLQSTSPGKSLLIVAAISLFAIACVAAGGIAPRLGVGDVSAQESKRPESAQNDEQEERSRKERQGKKEDGLGERREQLKLAREAKITMAQAVQQATNQQAGTVLEAKLGRDKGGEVAFKVLVLDNDRTDGKITLVVINGLDGRVIKTEGEYIR